MKDEDLKDVARLFAKEYAKPPWDVNAPIDDTLASVTFFYTRGAGFVAEEESIVGALIYDIELYQKGEVGTIKEFVVSADQQRKGIGTKLLLAFEEQCKDMLLLKLGTNKDADAVKFYESLGYVPEKNALSMIKILQ